LSAKGLKPQLGVITRGTNQEQVINQGTSGGFVSVIP
jgi:hypothetical protein